MPTRGLTSLVIGCLVAFSGGVPACARTPPRSLEVQEVLQTLQEKSILFQTAESVNTNFLNAAVKSIDRYARFFTATEFRSFKAARSVEAYYGVGMNLAETKAGQILCFPTPGSPAFLAGIRDGDRLLKVDNVSTQAASIFEVGMMIRGEQAAIVRLTTARSAGAQQTHAISRQQTWPSSVYTEDTKKYSRILRQLHLAADTHTLRIDHFSRTTASEVRKMLSSIPMQTPVLIDLRGNQGGQAQAAFQLAEMFLEPRTVLATIVQRDGTEVVRASASPKTQLQNPVYIYQDDLTASAAELFIAALTENHRAQSVGRVSFGKFRGQTLEEFPDGSALFLTTSKFMTPSGLDLEGIGLRPTLTLME